MTYTEEAKQALSRKVAEKFDIEDHSGKVFSGHDSYEEAVYTWLHDDWHTIMELCVEHGVDAEIKTFKDSGHIHTIAKAVIPSGRWFVRDVRDHNNPSEAERIARLLALGEC